jgi:hypothetical protein
LPGCLAKYADSIYDYIYVDQRSGPVTRMQLLAELHSHVRNAGLRGEAGFSHQADHFMACPGKRNEQVLADKARGACQ